MASIYKNAFPAVKHYQIPQIVADTLLKHLRLPEWRLLHYIYSEAQRLSRSDVKLTTAQITEKTGIHKTCLPATRQKLVDYGLILAEKSSSFYTYLICDPETRIVIPDRYTIDKVDFNQPPEIMQRYIKDIIPGCTVLENSVIGRCPLPGHSDSTPSFTFYDTRGGQWECRGCKKKGNLMALERHMARDSKGDSVSDDELYKNIVRRFRRISKGAGKQRQSRDIVYSYRNSTEDEVYQIVRVDGRKDKTRARRPVPDIPEKYLWNLDGVDLVLYNLPEVLSARTVIVTEGERDADTVASLNLTDDVGLPIVATTNPLGAGKWRDDYSEVLKDKRVILLGDTDTAGVEHMDCVEASLKRAGNREMVRVDLSPHKDVTLYLEDNSIDDLIDLIGQDWVEPVFYPESLV